MEMFSQLLRPGTYVYAVASSLELRCVDDVTKRCDHESYADDSYASVTMSVVKQS